MTTLTKIMPIDKIAHVLVGIVIALGAAAIKEWVIDAWLQLGEFDVWDFWATVAGGVIGSGVAYVLPLIGRIV